MYPELFRIPLINRGVPAYGTMLMIGFLLGVLFTRRRAKCLGLEKAQIFDLGFFAVIGGILGARLLHVGLNLGFYFEWPEDVGFFKWVGASFVRVISTWRGGLVFYGGLGGAMLALWIYARRRKIPLVDMLDFSVPGAALGLAMTRIGCFLNGCCFGKPSSLPWAVRFPEYSHVHTQQRIAGLITYGDPPLPVHPVQLYETLAALSIFLTLWLLYPKRKFAGQIAAIFGLLYSAWRFCNEFFRADSGPWRPEFGSLTVFQCMSILLFAGFAVALAVAWRRGRAPYQPPPEGEKPRPARKEAS